MSRRMAARLAVAKDILGYECDRPITLRWNDRMTLVEQYRTRPGRVSVKGDNESASRDAASKWAIIGWIISFAGPILWLYGYFEFGSPPLINWYSMVPVWIAQFFRNIECEAGMACSLTGMLLVSWPHLR
jgi:hypothetical protein